MREGSSTAWSGARIAFAFCSALLLAAAQAAELGDCYDGDTCTLWGPQGRYKVRLHCIDAPELGQRPWGQRAREALLSRVRAGVEVRIVDTDRYGRSVARLYGIGGDVGLALVREGMAVVYREHCHDTRYDEAEAAARRARLGVWAEPGLQQLPWVWRKAYR